MNNVVLLTGASGAIGTEIATLLHEKGYPLALHYHKNREGIDELFKHFRGEGAPYIAVQADISSESEIVAMAEEVRQRIGHVSILINNAGIALPQQVLNCCSSQDFDRVFDINVRGSVLLTRECIPHMLPYKDGCIINISSVWGLVGASCEVIYSASKAAVIGFTKALAKELAPSNIRVNCIAPGFVLSPMNAHLSTEDVQSFIESTPLQRSVEARAVAEGVAYFVEATSVTGQILSIDCGASL
ncbi:MAG: SDR family NAD(P)-dependent oxidoreductase [Clostridia bacterium]|nr:SDR family NAD(P)-dependent oxidoreductase [Clostridia bacterium]